MPLAMHKVTTQQAHLWKSTYRVQAWSKLTQKVIRPAVYRRQQARVLYNTEFYSACSSYAKQKNVWSYVAMN